MNKIQKWLLAKSIWSAVVLAALSTSVEAAEFLGRYNIDTAETTVSGISSGAFMAHQFHLAQSDIVGGVAIIAGGPYYCAKGRVTFAVSKCMQPHVDGGPKADESLEAARDAEKDGLIPPLSNLVDDKVYIFSGTKDTTVTPVAGIAVRDLYDRLGVKTIQYTDSVQVGHAYVTLDQGGHCESSGSPYIVDCDLDEAGNILAHLIGDLKPKATRLTGRVIEFRQTEFARRPEAIGMADTGYVFVPQACSEGKPCKLHVALHGCADIVDLSNGMTHYTAYCGPYLRFLYILKQKPRLANRRATCNPQS